MNCPDCGNKTERSIRKRYHYTESGLDNIYVRDSVFLHKCACGHTFVEIARIERLHDAIAYHVLNKQTLWSGREFRFLRKWIGLTAKELGKVLGHVSRVTISRWENDKIRITPATHHQMLLLVLRLKEEAIGERMRLEVAIEEFLGKVADKARKPVPITITPDSVKNLPFAASSGRSAHHGLCV